VHRYERKERSLSKTGYVVRWRPAELTKPKRNKRNREIAEQQAPMTQLDTGYSSLLDALVQLVHSARLSAVRSVNTILTGTYWLIGRRIVEHEQAGSERAVYGQELMKRLAADLTNRLGRGVSQRNIEQMRVFYVEWKNPQTPSVETVTPKITQTASAQLLPHFPLPWSHYVRLMTVDDLDARRYYEQEALLSHIRRSLS
jgi:hypothetical protein